MEKKRILIADDDPVMQDLMKTMLITLDIEIDTVSNGKAAMERIKNISYDLVITDYLMPEMDGLELIRRIKGEHPRLPVILVTGTLPADTVSKSEIAAYINKPFKISHFRKTVTEILQKYPIKKVLPP